MICTRPQTLDYHKGGHNVPCGYCPSCRYNDRVGWTFRISEEAKHSKEAWFITLTYTDDTIPIIGEGGDLYRGVINNRLGRKETLIKEDPITFINSVKKRQARAYKDYLKSQRSPSETIEKPIIKYYLVGEYGTKYGRPHYHLIVFNLWESIARELELEKIWQKGRIETESANPKLIHYITGYLYEKSEYTKGAQVKPFMSCSKGLGKGYIKRAKQYHKDTLNPFVKFNNYKIAMPRYYKDKIFTETEQEIISEKIQEFHSKRENNPPSFDDTWQQRAQWEHSIKSRQTKRRL